MTLRISCAKFLDPIVNQFTRKIFVEKFWGQTRIRSNVRSGCALEFLSLRPINRLPFTWLQTRSEFHKSGLPSYQQLDKKRWC
jgi:hypothetical protein